MIPDQSINKKTGQHKTRSITSPQESSGGRPEGRQHGAKTVQGAGRADGESNAGKTNQEASREASGDNDLVQEAALDSHDANLEAWKAAGEGKLDLTAE